jgi:hypothetical protein
MTEQEMQNRKIQAFSTLLGVSLKEYKATSPGSPTCLAITTTGQEIYVKEDNKHREVWRQLAKEFST